MESTSPQQAQAPSQPQLSSFQNYSEYLKMEDTQAPSTSPALSDDMEYTMQPTPSSSSQPDPIVISSRPAKKRKSWGQKLPEPKTKLPPRRRAKTEDEKEQRRIERIARNRAAAHNSRERKRQETEDLAVALAKAKAELDAYRTLHGPLPAHIVLPEVHVAPESSDPVSVDTPAPSLAESHGTHGDAPSPRSPADHIFQFQGVPQIKEELDEIDDMSTFAPELVHTSFDKKSSVPVLPGPMQDSAEILFHDLPRQSSSTRHSSTTRNTRLLANLLLTVLSIQFQLCYRTIMTSLWMDQPLRVLGMIRRSEKASSIGKTSLTTILRAIQLQYGHRAPHLQVATGLYSLLSQQSSLNEVLKAKRLTSRAVVQTEQTREALPEKRTSDDLAYGSKDERNDSVGVGGRK